MEWFLEFIDVENKWRSERPLPLGFFFFPFIGGSGGQESVSVATEEAKGYRKRCETSVANGSRVN